MENNYKYDVFISYRRNGGSERAELLKLILEKYGYNHSRIFMDTHSIESCNFKQKIKEAICFSKDFLLIITKGCFDSVKEEDYWIFEIKEALSLGKRIIPIFFDGIESIDSKKLPEELTAISEINGIIYHPQYADAFYIKLLSFINPSFTNIEKTQRSNKNLLLALICFIIVMSVSLFLIYMREATLIQQDDLTSVNIDSIRDNNIKTTSMPLVLRKEDEWVVYDINSGLCFEKTFSNHDFMEIVHFIISRGIANGEITSFSKDRQFPPVSFEHRNEIWCLNYSGGQSETIIHTTFQRLLRGYLREQYRYEDKNKIKIK